MKVERRLQVRTTGIHGWMPTDCECCCARSFRLQVGNTTRWDAYDRVMAEERRVAVLIRADRVYSN